MSTWFGKAKCSIPLDHPEKVLYDHLGQLAGAYLMQDHKICGKTPEEVLAFYLDEVGPLHATQFRQDIRHFLDAKSSLIDEDLAKQYNEISSPGIPLEGWNGRQVVSG